MNEDPKQIVPVLPLAKLNFEPISGEHAPVMIAAIFTALSREMMSGDLLYLAFSNASRIAMENGVPEAEVEEFMTKIAKIWDASRRRNPLSSMM